MKKAYPIVMEKDKEFISVFIPDFNVNTQGENIIEAIDMARDAIGMLGIELEDNKKSIPEPSEIDNVKIDNSAFVTLVDIDFKDYRRKNSLKTVKKNCSIPSWLCYEAEKNNINFSKVLQKALKQELNL